MTAEPPDGVTERPPSSILGSRLAADCDDVPDLEALGLGEVKDAAFAWQAVRNYASWNESVWVTQVDAERSRWVPELHGQFGIVGETVLVATEAEVEKEILRRVRSQENLATPVIASLNRSTRFFAEGQANYLVVACHGCTNIALRTLLLFAGVDSASVARSIDGLKASHLSPKSRKAGAWLSCTPNVIMQLRAIATTLGPEPSDLIDALDAIRSDDAIEALFKLRNNAYHRWRGESPGVTGINLDEDAFYDRLERREVIGFTSQMISDYTEGAAVLEELVIASRSALDALCAHMPGFLDAWAVAFHAARGSHET